MEYTFDLLFGSLIPPDNMFWRGVVFFLINFFGMQGFWVAANRWNAHQDYINCKSEEEASNVRGIEVANKFVLALFMTQFWQVSACFCVSVASVVLHAFGAYAIFFIAPVILEYRLIRTGRLNYPDAERN